MRGHNKFPSPTWKGLTVREVILLYFNNSLFKNWNRKRWPSWQKYDKGFENTSKSLSENRKQTILALFNIRTVAMSYVCVKYGMFFIYKENYRNVSHSYGINWEGVLTD